MLKYLKIFLIVLVLFNIYLCSYSVIHNDIGYHTDIARDFLILQNTVDTHKPPLIGPRTGGIDGLFHGPLWPWLNLPAFILGNGNPIVIGWFWIVLVICSIAITYYVGSKIFNQLTGLLSALIVSVAWVPYANLLYNPSGAIIVSPLFFYFFYTYTKTLKVFYLLLAFIVIGVLIQFEVAFGGPLLVLTILYLLYSLHKNKRWNHLLAIFILIIPLSTYILFDIRHDFLQLKSILGSIGEPTGSGDLAFAEILKNRYDSALKGIAAIPFAPLWFHLLILGTVAYVVYKAIKDKKMKYRNFYLQFAYFYIGYWPLSFYLNGHVLGFHTLPFLPATILLLTSSYTLVRKEIYALLIASILFFTYTNASNKITFFNLETGVSAGSWKFNSNLAENVINNSPKEFGYFVYTANEWGYGPRYAMQYTLKKYPQVHAESNTKKGTTVLILAEPLEGIEGNREWWIKNKVKISNKPIREKKYNNDYKILFYSLTPEEAKIPPDPNLVDNLFFR